MLGGMSRSNNSSALSSQIAKRLQETLSQHPTINTQAELGAASGIQQSTISKILRGESDPAVSTLHALANGLGIPLMALVRDIPIAPAHLPSAEDLALAHLAPLPRAFVDVALRVIDAGGLSDAECAKLIGEWGARLPPTQ